MKWWYNGGHKWSLSQGSAKELLDLLLKDGFLIDPEKMTILPGSLGVKNGRIAGAYSVGADAPEAAEVVPLGGKAVAPGFIDVHAHLDGHANAGRRSLLQGITTSFGGNCGLSPIDTAAFYESQKDGFCVNQAEFVGHSFSLREAVGITDPRKSATPDQLNQILALARRAMEGGAWGVSFGLDYCPGCSFREVEALGRLTAEFGGICPIHTRLFTMYDMYSISEAARLALEAGVQVQVSHLVYQYPMPDLLDDAFAMMEFARDRGANIGCDSGMYTDFAAPLGSATFDLETIEACDWKYSDFLVSTGPHRGERMTEALYRELRRTAPETEIVCFSGHSGAVEYAFECDYVMPSTDAADYRPGQGHPQAIASFPRFFRVLVREKKRMTWQEAVRRATLLPADTMGLKNKGRLREGADADLVVFDPNTISDNADFAGIGTPDAPNTGISRVLIAGKTAVCENEIVNDRLGKIIPRR